MRGKVVRVKRPPHLHGWTNSILRVNLDDLSVSVQETARYVPDFLGGRGIAAALAWDEYPEPVDPFSPASPLMIFTGALTGSRAAYSGRTCIAGFSPQAFPYRWFSRSNIGAHFGGELRRAGYDGLVVTGASETPVRILIRDDEVSILPAEEYWGREALEVIEALEEAEGRGLRSLVIGPAGERLSSIATIQTATSSAAGHGGYGAVMGSKKLKAISVLGSGNVSLADPERVMELSKALGEEARSTRRAAEVVKAVNARLAEEKAGSVRLYACTEACASPCNLYYRDVPGCVYPRKYSGHWTCVGGIFRGIDEGGPIWRRGVYDWRLGTRAGMEMNYLSNTYGLNQWDLIIGIAPWLEACQRAGLISEINGRPMDWRSPEFWATLLHAIAYREGIGDALAEGGWAAARSLHLGEDLMRRYYTAWGYAGHWDGHADLGNYVVFPYWLVPALQWLTDTRDPIPSGHGYAQRIMGVGPLRPDTPKGPEEEARWERIRAIGQRVYGTSDAVDPYAGYRGKGAAGVFHIKHSVMKDCLPGDDYIFPMIYSPNTPDGYAVVAGIEGPQLEYHLFVAGTGAPWSPEEFEQAALRVYALERAINVRHWGRDRQLDELALPSFEYPENWQNPWLPERYSLDREAFSSVIDDYYTRLGWDIERGWPTPETWQALRLPSAHAEMVAGAERARRTLPERPTLDPVTAWQKDAVKP